MAAQSFFGLDIGKTSIKIVQLSQEGKVKRLVTAGTIPSPLNGLSTGSDTDIGTYAQVIKKLVKDLKITTNQVNLSLPESKIFTRVVEMPSISDDELASALKWEAEQYVPVPLEEVNMDWQVLERAQNSTPEAKMTVLLAAAPKVLLNKYIKLAEACDLMPKGIEPETIALTRSLVTGAQKTIPTIILDMGAEETNLVITSNGLLTLTRALPTGGNVITRAIATNFGLEFVQAEEYKKTYGLEKEHFDGKLAEVIKPLLNVLAGELQKAVAFYQTKKPNDPVKRLILSGSGAFLPGTVRYFTESLGLETQLADPWQDITKDSRLTEFNSSGPSYAISCGLALREYTL